MPGMGTKKVFPGHGDLLAKKPVHLVKPAIIFRRNEMDRLYDLARIQEFTARRAEGVIQGENVSGFGLIAVSNILEIG